MVDQIIGTKLTAGSGDWHVISAANNLNQVTLLRYTGSAPGLLHRLGIFARRAGSTNARPQLAVWNVLPSGLPGALLGYTSTLGVSTANDYEASIVWSANDTALGVTGAAVRLLPGKLYFIGLHNENAGLEVAVATTAVATTVNRRSVPNGNPTDPFGTPSQHTPRPGAIWGVVTLSTAPVVTITAPAASIATSTPTITATVVDAESSAPTHDRLASYVIEVRQQGQTALFWNPTAFVATDTERSTATISRVYAGPSLSTGDWELRIQATDDAGAVGDWTDWHPFTIANLGALDMTNAVPLGKSESGVIDTWTARWTHPVPLNADGARVRVLQGTVVVRGGDSAPFVTLSPTVADQGFINLADTAALITKGPDGPLPSGAYTWQMQARDTGGGISAWSADVAFNVNFPPNTPADLRPISGSRVAALPRLDWLVSDPDLDDVLGTQLVTDWRITRPDLTLTSGTTSNVDPATGRGFLQVTAAMAPVNGDYQWEVRGRDNSAVAAGTGLGGWSAPAIFTLISAPIVTITAPTENQVLQTSSPQISWSVTLGTQTFYQVDVSLPNAPAPFFSSGQRTAASGTGGVYNIPGGVLQNGLFYDVRVTIWTAGDVVSTSDARRFQVQFPVADTVNNVQAALFLLASDYEPTTVTISWDPTGYATNEFAGYVVSRRLGADDVGDAVIVAHIKQAGQTTFVDYHPPPNVPLIYAVSQLRKVGADVRQSPVTEAAIDVPLTVPVIASTLSGADLRSPVIMLSDDYAEGFIRDETTVATWGTQGKPTLVRSPEGYGQRLVAVGFRIRTDARGTVQEHMQRWRDLVRSGHPVSLRTETERIFCHVVPEQQWLSRSSRRGAYEVALALEEIAWNESVTVRT